MENKKINQSFSIINFNEAYVPPVYTWNTSKNFISWGKKNNYPEYIQSLYNSKGSPLHTSIINKKVSYITGKGLEETLDTNLNTFIENNDLENEITKLAFDYEILNGFAIEIVWTRDGSKIKTMKHIPISQLRFGLVNDENYLPYFWFCKDWNNTRKFTPEPILAYNTDFPSGKQIYFYSTYNPQNILVEYPRPYYENGINQIETDNKISEFHLNQAKQGYAPSFLINFATGIPTQEEMEDFSKNFEKSYSGTENAGKVIITYSEGKDQAPLFQKIELNDSDKRFLMLTDYIERSIVISHDVPPQLLILTAGKLGGTNESVEKLKEFIDGYILTRQIKIEKIINKILSHNEYSDNIKIIKNADNVNSDEIE